MARVDQRIDDCYAITAGYHDAFIASKTNHPPQTTVDQASNKEMEELTEHLIQLQSQLKSQEGGTNDGEK